MLSNYPALSMTAYSYLFGAGLMSLTGCFFANGPSDWTLTRTEIACVLFSVRSSLLQSFPYCQFLVLACQNQLMMYCTHSHAACTLTSRILFTIAFFPLYSLTVLYWDDLHAGDCGISTQLLAVDLVKQDVGTFFSCTVHASPATRLIDPFTHISKEFTLFGKVSSSSVLTSVSRIIIHTKDPKSAVFRKLKYQLTAAQSFL